MRLTPDQIEQIKQTTHRYVDDVLSDWQLWLFGSRVNDEAKGGDVIYWKNYSINVAKND
jgi:hypothetical protein